MGLLDWYNYYNTEIADKRTNDLLLMSSPVPIILLSISYLYFVLRCGPNYMRDKKPYSLHTFIRCYNVFQVVANFLIIYHTLEAGWYQDYFIHCTVPDYTYNPKPYKMAMLTWYVFCLKVVDYIETGVFVLRKKNRQISFLHLYHHITTVFISWFVAKYYGNGMSLTLAMVNCSVHVIMYSYYFVSSFGPYVQKILQPVKKMITIMQMVQFWILMAYTTQAFIPGCPGMRVPAVIIFTDLMINFLLFYNFYRTTYTPKKNKVT